MKTAELIANLSKDFRARPPAEAERVYFGKWVIAAGLALTFWLWSLPVRGDLTARYTEWRFLFESILWVSLAAVSGVVAYRGRIPSVSTRNPERMAWILSTLLFIEVCAHFSAAGFADELNGELSFYRGRCGPLILIMGMSWAVALFWWIKRGAPTRPATSGAWAAFSSGCLAAFAMQFVCSHENTAHLVLWHLLPTAAIALAGYYVGQRVLRW